MGTTDGLVHRLWPNGQSLSLPSPARGEGDLSHDLSELCGSFNGIGLYSGSFASSWSKCAEP